ncbi:MAG: redoxin domain-containing protein [Myxococcota bacterium]|nr:redoxin domain-containing protein [Myxococcota bacterium]
MKVKSLVVGVVLGAFCALPVYGAELEAGFSAGDSAPNFTLKTVNGDVVDLKYAALDRYVGKDPKEPKKALLLSFFATYCDPCKKEMPFLATLVKEYRAKGLEAFLVSIDKKEEDIKIAKDLAAEHGVDFPVLADRYNIVAKRYGVNNLPCVYLINAGSQIDWVSIGYEKDSPAKLLAAVRQAIGEPLTDPVPAHIQVFLDHGEVKKQSQKSKKSKKSKKAKKAKKKRKSKKKS